MKYFRRLPLVALGLLGCTSIRDEFGGTGSEPTTSPGMSFAPGVPGPAPNVAAPDSRPVVTALTAPPPISGGTLLITRDATRAVAADPDRDRVSIVSLSGAAVIATIPLTPGDEPGRVVEDGSGRVHVALRRGGAIATIDLATNTVTARRAACGAPRGLAYDAVRDQLHVACAGGELVSFAAAGGDAVRRVSLDVDLRDVIARPDGSLFVTRFKSGDVIAVDPAGGMTSRSKLRPIERASDDGSFNGAAPTGAEPIEPAVAWRTLASPTTGSLFMLHQYGLASAIKLKPPTTSPPSAGSDPALPPGPTGPGGGSPYGTPPGGCGGLVQAAVTEISPDGARIDMGAPIVAPPLTVDAAMSPDGRWVLLAHAGLRDANAPVGPNDFQPSVISGSGAVSILDATTLPSTSSSAAGIGCLQGFSQIVITGQTTAVAFNPSLTSVEGTPWFAAQTREPASIVFFRSTLANPVTVTLGGSSVFDTGHELFHRDAGAGIACASCHAEGGEDGRVWRFDPTGERRTQALHVGLRGTEPFHWDGDMTNFGMLVEEVMVRRMGGPEESDPRKGALKDWIFSLKPPASIVAADDPSAVRGKALFQSADVGCSGCHSGALLTSNQNVFVGTTDPGHFLQVPSLHGIGYRAPFIHNGCAATLRDRFDPGCGGGDAHGRTSRLADADLGDLIAYLDSL